MEFTTRLVLQSQATRLVESRPYTLGLPGTDGIVTLSDLPSQANSPGAEVGTISLDYNSLSGNRQRFSI